MKDIGNTVDAMWSLVFPTLFKDIHAPLDPNDANNGKNKKEDEGGLSTAAIIAIILAAIAGVILIGLGIYYCTGSKAASAPMEASSQVV